jgi:hypothetical protein
MVATNRSTCRFALADSCVKPRRLSFNIASTMDVRKDTKKTQQLPGPRQLRAARRIKTTVSSARQASTKTFGTRKKGAPTSAKNVLPGNSETNQIILIEMWLRIARIVQQGDTGLRQALPTRCALARARQAITARWELPIQNQRILSTRSRQASLVPRGLQRTKVRANALQDTTAESAQQTPSVERVASAPQQTAATAAAIFSPPVKRKRSSALRAAQHTHWCRRETTRLALAIPITPN